MNKIRKKFGLQKSCSEILTKILIVYNSLYQNLLGLCYLRIAQQILVKNKFSGFCIWLRSHQIVNLWWNKYYKTFYKKSCWDFLSIFSDDFFICPTLFRKKIFFPSSAYGFAWQRNYFWFRKSPKNLNQKLGLAHEPWHPSVQYRVLWTYIFA